MQQGSDQVGTATGLAAIGESETDGRPLRADAVLNRRRLLEAAEEVFARDGMTAQVDAIAERAGVGVGTLYRHFPTKEALIEAIIRARLQDLIAQVEAYSESAEPGEVFFSFLREFSQHASAKRDLIDALGAAGIDFKSRCAEDFGTLRRGIERLLERAQEFGVVRQDVSTDEVIGLVAGTCHVVSSNAEDRASLEQMITIVSDGLRSTNSSTGNRA